MTTLSNIKWRRRLVTRGVLWLHIVFMALSVGLWYTLLHGGKPSFKSLHGWVAWVPLNPEVTWALVCTVTSVSGIFGWWQQNSRTYSYALILSTYVFLLRTTNNIYDNMVPQACAALALSICVILELALVPSNRRYTNADVVDPSAVGLTGEAGRAWGSADDKLLGELRVPTPGAVRGSSEAARGISDRDGREHAHIST